MTEGAAYLCVVEGVASTAFHGQPRSPIQLIPTPAQYSGLPKRTSRGTSSASAAENFIAVRVWGRLRGGVKAAADAMRIAAGLSILKRMSRAIILLQQHDSYTTVLGCVQLSSASSSCGFRAYRSHASRGGGLRPNGCEKTSV